MALHGLFATPARYENGAFAKLGDERLHPFATLPVQLGLAFDLRGQQRHGVSLSGGSDRRFTLVGSPSVKESETMLVRLSDPRLADEFLGFLRGAECVADVGEVSAQAEGLAVDVDVPQAHDGSQARLELTLYLRVWAAMHPGSGAELLN